MHEVCRILVGVTVAGVTRPGRELPARVVDGSRPGSGGERVGSLLQVAGEDVANHVDLGTLLTLDRAEQVVDLIARRVGRELALEHAVLGTHVAAFAQVVADERPER